MDFALTPDQRDFREQVRDFFAEPRVRAAIAATRALPPQAESGLIEVFRWLGERRWLAASWPRRYGGAGRTVVEAAVVTEEMTLAGLPEDAHVLSIDTVGRYLLEAGTEAQRLRHLPPLAAGREIATVLLTEPDCGSDLAAVTTRAVPDGDGWRISGRKVYSQKSQFADWALLLARTADAPARFHGLTLFLLPLTSPGVTISPLWALTDERFNEITIDGVRLDRSHVVGAVDDGWQAVNDMLQLERTGLDFQAKARRWFDTAARRAADPDGHVGADLAGRLADLDARLVAARALSWQRVLDLDRGVGDPVGSAVAKWYASEQSGAVVRLGMDVLGLDGALAAWDPEAPDGGQLEMATRQSPARTLASGTSEMMLHVIGAARRERDPAPGADLAAHPGAPADLGAPLAAARAEFDELFGAELAPIVRRLGEHPRDGAPLAADDAAARQAVWAALVELGGLEGGHAKLVALAELMGEVAYRGPVQDTLMARGLVGGTSDRIGSAPVAIAAWSDGRCDAERPSAMAVAGGLLTARRRFVPFAGEVEDLVVVGAVDGALGIYLVPTAAPGVRLRRHAELSRGDLYQVDIDGHPVGEDDRLVAAGLARQRWADAVADAMLRQAAYLVGLVRGATELAVAHTDRRRQFGQPLRRFQWVSHQLAAMDARVAAGESLVRLAAWRRDTGVPADRLVLQALAHAAELARDATAAAVQRHGALGMTEDCDAQLYFRLACVEAVRFGAPSQLRVRAGRAIAQESGRSAGPPAAVPAAVPADLLVDALAAVPEENR